jgi:hypothetical protein
MSYILCTRLGVQSERASLNSTEGGSGGTLVPPPSPVPAPPAPAIESGGVHLHRAHRTSLLFEQHGALLPKCVRAPPRHQLRMLRLLQQWPLAPPQHLHLPLPKRGC